MKKSTLIIIMIIFVASIAVINFFGLEAKVYNQIINVTSVECINQTDVENGVIVTKTEDGRKLIKIKFNGVSDIYNEDGSFKNYADVTSLQITQRVYPSNATVKDVYYRFDRENKPAVHAYVDGRGNEPGYFVFSGKVIVDIDIVSASGQKIKDSITVWVY